MAIIQVSRITHRKGLLENLPQLASAEIGWAVDGRRLFIGNGTTEEGAPVVGNTEILTEFTDILAIASSYTYKGEEAGYTVQTGPSAGSDITRTLQSKLDDFVNVRDFGAVGNGETDDTDAINRALFQLYCRELNTETRRSIYFPAGIYKLSDTIRIPPYARMIGDGVHSTILRYDSDGGTPVDMVATTADSRQQIGVNLGLAGAVTPRNVVIDGVSFEAVDNIDVFIVDRCNGIQFENCGFFGPRVEATLGNGSLVTVGLGFDSTIGLRSQNIRVTNCKFSGTKYGIFTDSPTRGVTVTTSEFDTLYRGVFMGETPVDGGPTGTRVIQSVFDSIAQEGVYFANVSQNVSAYNVFYEVGNGFAGAGNPAASIVRFGANNNLSIGDMFERDDTDAITWSRVYLGNTRSIAFDQGKQMQIGQYVREAGEQLLLSGSAGTNSLIDVDVTNISAFVFTYTAARDTIVRQGKLQILDAASENFSEEYDETGDLGLDFSVVKVGNVITIQYDVTGLIGTPGIINYSISRLM